MLYFVGLGIDQSLTLRAREILEKCEKIFYESYTSPTLSSSGQIPEGLQTFTDGDDSQRRKVELVRREFVEDGRKIIQLAGEATVALVSPGDSLIATTHQELRTRAIQQGVRTSVVHGSSIVTSVVGELGLHYYNCGRTVTLTRSPMQFTAYNTIFQNLLRGLHTVILLEWDAEASFFLSPNEAARSLADAEMDLSYGVIGPDLLMLCASRLGSTGDKMAETRELLKALTLDRFKDADFGGPPHTLVIPGRLHFTEHEALRALTCAPEEILAVDNSSRIKRTANRMLEKYSQKTLRALARARERARGVETRKGEEINFDSVFENVEAYTTDALRFLNEGKEELAVLSMGYAEGLLDSLRFAGLLEFEW